ncbi:amidase family protein [Microbacterium sp. P03]|uniref:amidase family protein n=1 Tax=Microbacterium sp. P03 TaxID=3366946 RepID=UPI0037453A17
MIQFDFDDLQNSAHRVGTHIHDYERDDVVQLAEWMASTIDEFLEVSRALVPAPSAVPAVRVSGATPAHAEDPLNAIVRWVDVVAVASEVQSDLLAGKKIGMKDLIAVAGIPISAASLLLEGFVPREDAVVTERVLRAGGHIVAMTNMEGVAFGGGGESGIYGATLNPFDLTRSTSGSSGGSAASLFYDGIDITFGTDQGGSVRLPASWCGVLGLKPTHSLVPYTGIASHDLTFDHVGPMTRTTENMALAMAAISGPHISDVRQDSATPADLPFVQAWADAPDTYEGVRFGLLTEALASDGTPEREAALAGFADAVEKIRALGGEVVEVSIPEHDMAASILFGAMLEGVAATLHGNGEGYHRGGGHSVDVRRAVGKGLLAHGDELQAAYKTAAVLGEHLRSKYFGTVYATAQTVIPVLRAAYDRAFEEVDVVLMATTRTPAMRLKPEASVYEMHRRSFSMTQDTPAHNATGHPALSLPGAESEGLPLGVTFVGRFFDDARLIALARTWEKAYGWLPANAPVFRSGKD